MRGFRESEFECLDRAEKEYVARAGEHIHQSVADGRLWRDQDRVMEWFYCEEEETGSAEGVILIPMQLALHIVRVLSERLKHPYLWCPHIHWSCAFHHALCRHAGTNNWRPLTCKPLYSTGHMGPHFRNLI